MLSVLTRLIRSIAPSEAGVGICTVKQMQGCPVQLPELRQLGPRVTGRRRLDFYIGRLAAREALGAIGIENQPVPRGSAGQPIWPTGIVGSITHSEGVAVAVVLRAVAGGVGVDLELRSSPLSRAAERLVLTRHEQRWIRFAGGAPWPLILFSAKEAAYKALPEELSLELGFQDIEFRTNGAGSLASASPWIPPYLAPEARYAWTPALVLTVADRGPLS